MFDLTQIDQRGNLQLSMRETPHDKEKIIERNSIANQNPHDPVPTIEVDNGRFHSSTFSLDDVEAHTPICVSFWENKTGYDMWISEHDAKALVKNLKKTLKEFSKKSN